MTFLLTQSNPNIELELKEFQKNWKRKEQYAGFGFFNNFFHTYFPHQDRFGRKETIQSLKGDLSKTFRDIQIDFNLEYGMGGEDDLENYSQLFLNTKVIDFFDNVDTLLSQQGCIDKIRSYNGDLWDLLEQDKHVADSAVAVYFELRKQGYHRYKDLIA
ncbi:MAG: hypothetical protein OEL89_02275 [Candidatus Peregrinibacteria bacterium]|nr:hypothetical protein [Candidatus Peregrinibacteria bacterium]